MSNGEVAGQSLSRKLAGVLANSFLFAKGRRLWNANTKDWYYPLSKMDKLLAGSYLILSDYSAGLFPPKFDDRETAYSGEINYHSSIPGVTIEGPFEITKPFSSARTTRIYITRYVRLLEVLERYGVLPPKRVLELGCGSGWMCELLANVGYNVVGSTIAPVDIEVGLLRKKSLECKGITSSIDFEAAPMEFADRLKCLGDGFDCVFMFEALHHAFDWRETLSAVHKCLKPGGWFLLANEPRHLHTFISYRVAKLSNTHEIGMSKRALTRHLKKIGFTRVDPLGPKFFDPLGGICIMAQKAP
jgi:2-polyprenyl-3-methyl-5-hydroxy-6-metoxy-1,4-benzoquinol methylase